MLCLATCAAVPAAADDAGDFFEAMIRPVLVDNCYECHSAESDAPKGGLRVDTRDGILEGGDSGPAVIPNDPEESLLLKAISYDDCFYQMPPDRKLDDTVVDNFRQWIEQGAIDPRGDTKAEDSVAETTPDAPSPRHWAFETPQIEQVDVPVTEAAIWHENGLVANRIDEYVLEGLSNHEISPSPTADDRTLVRRLYFDLIGLPPTYDDATQYAESNSAPKYETLVDKLLASKKFGERWARHWLDVARFADTKGYVFTADRNYKDAFKYRDWVIKAFNDDLPFNQFVRLQIAADRIPDAADKPAELAAMGFLTLGRRFLNNRHDIIDDRIDVVTRGFMGLTVTCARCHDHKYDPIPTADYYSLYGVFASSKEPGDDPSPLRLIDKDKPSDARIFLRGNSSRPGDVVPRRFLQVVSRDEREPFRDGSGRLELADCIASAENPLTARVFVNRVWGHLTGQHIVDTPSDFGIRSTLPVQRKLLDYLAIEFIDSDWSMKSLIRMIVMSNTYRQQSLDRQAARAVDPSNSLMWKGKRRRLDFEALRDAMLFVAGQLDDSVIGGPSTDIAGDGPANRRTVYSFIDRQNFPSLFRAFDVATPDAHAPKRFETTVPQQSLYLMNHSFAESMAKQATGVALSNCEPTATQLTGSDMVVSLYRKVLSRDPTGRETRLIRNRFFNENAPPWPANDQRWFQLAHVLLMSNEFAFLD